MSPWCLLARLTGRLPSSCSTVAAGLPTLNLDFSEHFTIPIRKSSWLCLVLNMIYATILLQKDLATLITRPQHNRQRLVIVVRFWADSIWTPLVVLVNWICNKRQRAGREADCFDSCAVQSLIAVGQICVRSSFNPNKGDATPLFFRKGNYTSKLDNWLLWETTNWLN